MQLCLDRVGAVSECRSSTPTSTRSIDTLLGCVRPESVQRSGPHCLTETFFDAGKNTVAGTGSREDVEGSLAILEFDDATEESVARSGSRAALEVETVVRSAYGHARKEALDRSGYREDGRERSLAGSGYREEGRERSLA